LKVAGSNDSQGLVVFCGGRISTITGNTLDTFRKGRRSAIDGAAVL
jgi:hypothetical protein